VTVKGILAGDQCRDLVDVSWAGIGAPYIVGHTTEGPVICRLSDGRRRITVRDDGIFMLIGNALCEALASAQCD
jgi:hypothetical protein